MHGRRCHSRRRVGRVTGVSKSRACVIVYIGARGATVRRAAKRHERHGPPAQPRGSDCAVFFEIEAAQKRDNVTTDVGVSGGDGAFTAAATKVQRARTARNKADRGPPLRNRALKTANHARWRERPLVTAGRCNTGVQCGEDRERGTRRGLEMQTCVWLCVEVPRMGAFGGVRTPTQR